ncbi:MAG: SDR family NAD(P)-dependent oxidoreductase [Deltaproteobacteria bacterium]|nr:SDR family NAD(P)-dependent oxidoreductase [Deltaproteobacteria bacterium]
MQQLSGRVAVVTGAASGIGLALARRFGEEGMKVVLSDVEEGALADAVKTLETEGHRVVGIACDVRSQQSVDDLRDAALRQFGAVHVVCNNAGVARAPGGGYMWEYDLNDWNWILSVNVMGVVHGLRSFVPVLLEQGEEGHIVNTSSGNGGLSPLRGLPIYAASKSAVTQISECLWGQLQALTDAVGVSVLYPGPKALDTGLWTAERNRPQELAWSKPREAQTVAGLREYMANAGVDLELTPLGEIADFVARGIREQRFWLIPDAENIDQTIRTRAESMIAREAPEYMIQARELVVGGMGGGETQE